MRIQIFAHGLDATEDLQAYIKRRLLFAVGRFAPKIERIDAGLIDVNGRERGGEVRFRCPNGEKHSHGDANPSASWNRGKKVWRCAVCDGRGGVMSLALQLGIAPAERLRTGGRKRIGAKPSAILLQFLVEAVMLCFFGGLVGLLIGQLMTMGIAAIPGAKLDKNDPLHRTYVEWRMQRMARFLKTIQDSECRISTVINVIINPPLN